jgi:3-oxoacyl-[acyl-carrier protein] reductase
MKSFEKNLPTRKIGNPNEIGKFVRFVVENKIKYLTGSTIYFDGNINKSII